MPLQLIKRLHQDDSGQVIAWTVGSMLIVFALFAFAIDLGLFFHARRLVQNAADPAALAGAAELPGCGDNSPTSLSEATKYANKNLQLKTYTAGDSIDVNQQRSYTVGGASFPSWYVRVKRQQKFLFARFAGVGLNSSVPAEAEAVCGPIVQGGICPFYIPGDPSAGIHYDGNGKLTDAYGLQVGVVYSMKESDTHKGAIDPATDPPSTGTSDWRDFVAGGCESEKKTTGDEVTKKQGNWGNVFHKALEGENPVTTGLYDIEKTYGTVYGGTNLFPNGHLDCDFKLTLDGSGNVTSVQNYNSSGHPTGVSLTPQQIVTAINQKTNPPDMASSTAPACAGVRKDGTQISQSIHPSVQGRFMQIAMADASDTLCTGHCDMQLVGILRMYIVCWTNQTARSGNIPAADLCVPNASSDNDTTIYGVFADFSAPNALPAGGLGNNPLAPKHVVLVK